MRKYDKFATDRLLPKIDTGDILYIHDTGAHGFSMVYNYNGKLRSARSCFMKTAAGKSSEERRHRRTILPHSRIFRFYNDLMNDYNIMVADVLLFIPQLAGVLELADETDSKSVALYGRVGSIPTTA